VRSLTWRAVLATRLARQHLTERSTGGRAALAAVTADVCGIHAQVGSAAELSLAARVDGVGPADVRAALVDDRTIVKTYGPRGTLHLLPADELALWMAARRARPDWQGDVPTRVVDAIGDALDGRCLTRVELADEVGRRAGPDAGERLRSHWATFQDVAAYVGALCFGPNQGARVTYVRPDQWLGRWDEAVEPRAALDEVCRRYLRTYGPAAPAHLARWFGTAPADAKAVFGRLGDVVEEVDVEGARLWRLRGDEPVVRRGRGPVVRLLPQYDCYVVGSHPRTAFVSGAVRARVQLHPRGRFEGVVATSTAVVDGEVVGLWQRTRRRRVLEIDVELVVPVAPVVRRALEDEAARIAVAEERSLAFGVVG
jgi:hypothetical protein